MIRTSRWSNASQDWFSTSFFHIWHASSLDEGAGFVELLLGVQQDVVEAVRGAGHRIGRAIRGRTRSPPPARSLRGGNSTSTIATTIRGRQKRMPEIHGRESSRPSRTPTIPYRSSTAAITQERRLNDDGACAVVPPVLGVLGVQVLGERPELGAVEGVQLH